MKRTTKRAVIALDLTNLNALELVALVRVICAGLTNNPKLAAADIAKLPVTVAVMLAHALALETTHNGRATVPTQAATKLEGDQGTAVMDDLTNTAMIVEVFANMNAAGNVSTAEATILSIGFALSHGGVGIRHPHEFGASSPAKGQLKITVPTAPANASNLVRYSVNGGTAYSPQVTVHGFDVTITGLISATKCLIQHAVAAHPAKGTPVTLAAGSEEPAWGDAITCVIS